MSRIRIGKVAPNDPTGLTLAYSTGGQKPILGSVFDGDALKQKLGFADNPATTVPVGQKPATAATPKIDLVGDAYRLREQELAAQKAKEVEAAWKEHEALDQTAREIAQYEKSKPLIKNDVPDVVRRTASTPAAEVAPAAAETVATGGAGAAKSAAAGGALVPVAGAPAAAEGAAATGGAASMGGTAAEGIAHSGRAAAGGAGLIPVKPTVIEDVPYEEVSKSKGLLSKVAGFIKNTGSKIANWFKGLPKSGKLGCIAGVAALLAAGIYGLCKLFGDDKEEKAPVKLPTDYNPQVPVDSIQDPAAQPQPGANDPVAQPGNNNPGTPGTNDPNAPGVNDPVNQPNPAVPVVPVDPGKDDEDDAVQDPDKKDDNLQEIKDDVKEIKDDVKEVKDDVKEIKDILQQKNKDDEIQKIKDDVKEIKDDVKEVKDDVKEIKDKLLQPNDPKPAPVVAPEEPEDPAVIEEPEEPVEPEEPAEPEEPVAVEEPEEPAAPAEPKEDENVYTVVKGDCVWNIAKAHLIKLHEGEAGYTPSNAEIRKHTDELMEYNPQLHWEPDHYHVMIRPGDKINLVKKEEE